MYAKDLTPFYESKEIKPLLQDHVVKHGDRTYRVDRWFLKNTHCYTFTDITMNISQRKNTFAKKPSEVQKLLKEKKLIITNSPY